MLEFLSEKKNYALEELKNYRDEGGAEYEYQLLTGKILAQQAIYRS
ncbi:hypothetical protein O9992_30605 [Vibrio lentus]|nr:hypothetical protein [Vibrio lentus]